jgi:hypothetical protein
MEDGMRELRVVVMIGVVVADTVEVAVEMTVVPTVVEARLAAVDEPLPCSY